MRLITEHTVLTDTCLRNQSRDGSQCEQNCQNEKDSIPFFLRLHMSLLVCVFSVAGLYVPTNGSVLFFLKQLIQ